MRKEIHRRTGTRRALIEAFRDLVNRKDFDRITVREIAELAGVSRNSFYSYYANTADLLDDVVHERIVGCYYVEETDHWCGWEESKENLTAFFDENRDFLADVFCGAEDFRRTYFFGLCMDILDLAAQKLGWSLPADEKMFLAGGLGALVTDWLFRQRDVTPRAFADWLYSGLQKNLADFGWPDPETEPLKED